MPIEKLSIPECRLRCEMSIRNTATGEWLGRALDELEETRNELQWHRRTLSAAQELIESGMVNGPSHERTVEAFQVYTNAIMGGN